MSFIAWIVVFFFILMFLVLLVYAVVVKAFYWGDKQKLPKKSEKTKTKSEK